MALKNLMVRIGADISNMQRGMRQAQSSMDRFSRGISRSTAAIGATLASIGIGAALKNVTSDAMAMEVSLEQVNRMMGKSAQEFVNWAESSAGAFNFSKKQAIEYGGVFSNLISTFAKDTKQIQGYTQSLLEANAVVASKTGRTIDDVNERIRSGMLGNTEAIEDLGIFVGISMIESTNAFRQFAGDKSWAQLDFQTQQTIRYFAILEQAATKYGATVSGNTSSQTAQLVAQLNNLKLAMGQAYLPIWQTVLPALSALVGWLVKATNIMAQFVQVLFGKSVAKGASNVATGASNVASAVGGVGDAYKGAGKSAKKAAKEQKGFLAAFDEINSVADKANADDATGGSGGGAGGGVGAGGVDTSAIPVFGEIGDAAFKMSEKIKEMAQKFKEFLAPLKPYVDNLKDAFNNVKQSIKDLMASPAVQEFKDFIKEFIKEYVINFIKGQLMQLSGVFDTLAGAIDIVTAALTGDFAKAIEGVEKVIGGLYDIITGILYPIFPEFAAKMEEFKKNFSEKWASLKEIIKKYGDPTKLEASDFGNYIKDKLTQIWDQLKLNTSKKWNEIKTAISESWTAMKNLTWGDVKNILLLKWDELVTNSATKWDQFKTTLSDKWNLIKTTIKWDEIKKTLLGHWDTLKMETSKKWDDLKQAISDKWDLITGIDFSGVKTGLVAIWGSLKIETEAIWESIGRSIKNSINSVIGHINSFIDKVNSVQIEIPGVSAGGKELVKGFSIGLPTIPRIPALAKGGITNGPMLAMIGDNAGGQEVVSPLDDLKGMIGEVVSAAMQYGGNQQQNGDVVLSIDGTAFARIANPYFSKETKRIGSSLIRTT